MTACTKDEIITKNCTCGSDTCAYNEHSAKMCHTLSDTDTCLSECTLYGSSCICGTTHEVCDSAHNCNGNTCDEGVPVACSDNLAKQCICGTTTQELCTGEKKCYNNDDAGTCVDDCVTGSKITANCICTNTMCQFNENTDKFCDNDAKKCVEACTATALTADQICSCGTEFCSKTDSKCMTISNDKKCLPKCTKYDSNCWYGESSSCTGENTYYVSDNTECQSGTLTICSADGATDCVCGTTEKDLCSNTDSKFCFGNSAAGACLVKCTAGEIISADLCICGATSCTKDNVCLGSDGSASQICTSTCSTTDALTSAQSCACGSEICTGEGKRCVSDGATNHCAAQCTEDGQSSCFYGDSHSYCPVNKKFQLSDATCVDLADCADENQIAGANCTCGTNTCTIGESCIDSSKSCIKACESSTIAISQDSCWCGTGKCTKSETNQFCIAGQNNCFAACTANQILPDDTTSCSCNGELCAGKDKLCIENQCVAQCSETVTSGCYYGENADKEFCSANSHYNASAKTCELYSSCTTVATADLATATALTSTCLCNNQQCATGHICEQLTDNSQKCMAICVEGQELTENCVCNTSTCLFNASTPKICNANKECILSCSNGQYYNETSSECTNCDKSCATCLAAGSCQSCADGYWGTGPTCSMCGNICKTCTTGTKCDQCIDGYYLKSSDEGSCGKCGDTCTTCTDATLCTTCVDGYYYDEATETHCSKCKDGCGKCTNKDDCSKAADGYYMDSSNTIQKCDDNCATCKDNATTCVTCNPGQYSDYISKYVCVNCSTGCNYCNTNESCETCFDGYYKANASDKTCTACIKGCGKCTNNNDCSVAADGYYMDSSNTIQKCATGCAKCTSKEICLGCKGGYTQTKKLVTGSTTVYTYKCKKDGVSGGVIAGLVIALVIFAALLAFLIWFFMIYKPKKQALLVQQERAKHTQEQKASSSAKAEEPAQEKSQQNEQVVATGDAVAEKPDENDQAVKAETA